MMFIIFVMISLVKGGGRKKFEKKEKNRRNAVRKRSDVGGRGKQGWLEVVE